MQTADVLILARVEAVHATSIADTAETSSVRLDALRHRIALMIMVEVFLQSNNFPLGDWHV